MFGRNDNPCGYNTLLITLLLGNNLVHFPNSLHHKAFKALELLGASSSSSLDHSSSGFKVDVDFPFSINNNKILLTFDDGIPCFVVHVFKKCHHSSLPIVMVDTIQNWWSNDRGSFLSIVHMNISCISLELTQTDQGACSDANWNSRSHRKDVLHDCYTLILDLKILIQIPLLFSNTFKFTVFSTVL